MVDNFRLTVDSNTEIEPLETVRDVRMKGQSLVDNRVATIPQMTGATSSSNGSAGVVPTPSVGDREKFLRGDGTWAEASGGGGSNVSVDQILDDGVNIMDITIDNVTTHIYAPENDPNAVVDVEVNGVSVVTNNVAEITISESVTDVVDANGDSLVDANGVAHVTGEVVDVVNGDGDSLVDENGVAHVTGDITDVEYDGTSVVNENGVAELFSDRKITTLPLLDYDNATAIQGSSQWADSTPHDWVAPCDCVIIARNNRGNNGDTFVRYVIDGFIYYTTSNSDRSDSIPYGLYSDMIPVRKGHTVTIQLQGTIDTQRLQNRFYYIPYKEVNKSDIDFPLPYLDHEHRVSIDYSTTSYTANTDGLLICVTNGTKTLVVNSNTTATFYGRPNSSNYFDCSLPISSGDTVSGLSTGTKYFIPFKRTDNINKLVSPVPDYGNAVAYTGATLPERFSDYGFVFLTSQGMSQWTNTDNLSYSIGDTGNTAYLNISSTTINNVVYRKESFLPVDPTFVKLYGATAGETVYFVPYAEFESAYVKDVQIQGRSIVESGGIANIESLVTDVQYQGKSLVGEGGIAEVTGKVADVQLEGISILDENAVANLRGNMGIFTSPILDYDKIGFVEESKTWTDRTPHDWTAPCDCVIFSCSPNANGGYTFLVDGEFTYKVYKNAWGSYNSNVYASYYTMLPVAKGSVVTLTPTGEKDSSSSYKIAYIPYKKATTLQSAYTLPYLDYENKTAIEWASPLVADALICEYTAEVDGYVSIDLIIGTSTMPTVSYTINGNENVNIMTRAIESNYYPNGVILGKGDTISIYDKGNVPTYTYTGNIYFTPFATTPSLREVVSPIPDYANLETLDLTDFPTTFDMGYIFNCAERQGDNLLKYCKITLSDSVKIYTKSDPYNVTHEYSYFPISGDETLVSVEYETNAGNVYYIPYSEVEVTPVLVSDVQVNGASVVDANGVAHITGGGSGSTVTVTPIQTTGTKIAEIDVDGVTSDLYAPNGGGGSTVSVTQKVSSGENIASITVDGVATELYATNTTYSDFVGATSESAGTHGLVPAPTSEDRLKYLRANGTWGTPTNTTYSDFTGTDGTAAGTHGLVPAPTASDTNKYLKSDGTWATVSGGGGASSLDDLSDVNITTPLDSQILKYDGTSQEWVNSIIDTNAYAYYLNNGNIGGGSSSSTWTTLPLLQSMTNGFYIAYSNDSGTTGTSMFEWSGTSLTITTGAIQYRIDQDSVTTIYYSGAWRDIYLSIIKLGSESGGGGASDLDDLTDVDITSVSNGQILKYNSTTSKWENANGGGLTPVGLTQAEYDVLPTVQKEDTSKLYLVDNTGATAINMYYTTKFVENNVTITDYEHKTVLAWSNGSAIGQTWYYITPIDVTDIDTIQYNITTGSSTYGSVNGHNDVRNLGFGLRDTAPSAMTLINSMNFDLYNEYHDVDDLNETLIGEELDVSEMTGEYYLIGTGAGWNAEISNIVLVSGDGVNKKYVYWDDTVYGESRSDNLVGEEMTLSKYELLPAATKKDGTVRFIPSNPASESEAIDMEHIQSFIENPSCMAVTATSNTLTTVSYLGNVYIGCNYYYTTPIDVTGWDKIIMDVKTGNCYGGGTQATQQQFFLYIGLMENAPATTFNPTQVTWVTSVNYGLSNHDYSGTELDVKELSGEYYLVLSCHGWSATIENIQLANLGGYASQIKYMDETYGISNIMELTEGDYQALTNVEKNNGTVYFTYDGGYEYISYDNGAIIVRVDHINNKTLWFFNGFAKNANDMDIPTELVPYLPTQTSAQSVMMAKDWTDSTSTTTDGWIGFVYPGTQNVKIRSWNTSHYTDAVAGWAVLDIDGSTAEDGQTEPYQNPYTSTTMQPNHIYMNGRTYGENPSMDNYSVSERIVGTWIDGSDIYEVTITNLSETIASVAGWNTVDDVTDLDIDQVIDATYILSSGITTKAQGTYVDSDDLKVYFTDFANDVVNTAIIRYIKNTN